MPEASSPQLLTADEKARLLLREIREALRVGTKHTDLRGHPLTTPRAIVAALLRDGSIVIETFASQSRGEAQAEQ